jgi:hypothetical protein
LTTHGTFMGNMLARGLGAALRASASLHGTRLVSDAALSPHQACRPVPREIHCGFGEHDELAPLVIRTALEETFAS